MSQIKPKWPRKQRLSEYAKNNFVDPKAERANLCRQCRLGELPAVKEGNIWFIWVLPDGSAAYGYSEDKPVQQQAKIDRPKTGNAIADAILSNYVMDKGIELR
ncbi:hypothetical protein [Marinomonas sp. FW-1]|uniref:hypothetical protein n=1 Tax=Marinomonas sp. FW-1 TaxID=2071621 RepID=UPI0010BFAF02|nr:hypothetical protein [Marinomonas sp. FW-1]